VGHLQATIASSCNGAAFLSQGFSEPFCLAVACETLLSYIGDHSAGAVASLKFHKMESAEELRAENARLQGEMSAMKKKVRGLLRSSELL
jgi:hypothetical protein